MLKKRIIPCLDIQNKRVVKGVNFEGIKDAGDPVELAKRYVEEGADELVFLDITATINKQKVLVELVEQIAEEINIPFTVGGGISSIADVDALIQAGADKISINSSAVRSPKLISEIADCYGSQCVVIAMDVKYVDDQWLVVVDGGRTPAGLEALQWAKQAEELGAGEILLTSMNHDGTKGGFAIDLTDRLCQQVSIPIIASGGAGKPVHFKEIFENSNASAALAASIFHYREVPIPRLKHYLKQNNIPIR